MCLLPADALRGALQALALVRLTHVSRANVTGGYAWSVTFVQDFFSVSNTTLVMDTSGVVPAGGATVLGQVRRQRATS